VACKKSKHVLEKSQKSILAETDQRARGALKDPIKRDNLEENSYGVKKERGKILQTKLD